MASDTEKVIRWFYRESFPSGILEFDNLLAQAAEKSLGKTGMNVESYVYASAKRHWNALLVRTEYDTQLGRAPIFHVEDRMNRRVSWVPREVGSLLSSRHKYRAIRLGARPHFLRMIDDLTDREYEALGCIISEFAGATHFQLTPKGNEGGIDFFSLINCPGKCHIFGGNYKPLRVVGQTKKYSDKVQVDEVKELTSTLEEIRNQNPSVEDLVPIWFRSGSGPIVGWLIAHNGVQSGGITKARNHGILVSDSVDLAEIAALSRHIEAAKSEDERVKMVKSKISEIMCLN